MPSPAFRAILGGSTLLLAALFLLKKKRWRKLQPNLVMGLRDWYSSKSQEEQDLDELEGQLWNTALFFPDHFPEKDDSTTRILMWYIDQAEATLDLCLYSLQFWMLEESLMMAAKRGVTVRILTNRNLRKSGAFRKCGIKTRTKIHCYTSPLAPSMYIDLLHHKFVIIDNFAIMTGSLNWTVAGITENKENVVINSNPEIVRMFKKEFQRLWLESAPPLRNSQRRKK